MKEKTAFATFSRTMRHNINLFARYKSSTLSLTFSRYRTYSQSLVKLGRNPVWYYEIVWEVRQSAYRYDCSYSIHGGLSSPHLFRYLKLVKFNIYLSYFEEFFSYFILKMIISMKKLMVYNIMVSQFFHVYGFLSDNMIWSNKLPIAR